MESILPCVKALGPRSNGHKHEALIISAHLLSFITFCINMDCENFILSKCNNGPQAKNWVSVLVQPNSHSSGRVRSCLLFIILFSSHFNSCLTYKALGADLLQISDSIGYNLVVRP
jgi:hypothetical protein